MENSKITLYQGDCLDYFSQIPTGSVDLIVTDPPYQIDNTIAGVARGSANVFSPARMS
ncbi:MAG: hypothetical protein ACI4TM_06730 [Candidatus Cryptobacteroides sp.]